MESKSRPDYDDDGESETQDSPSSSYVSDSSASESEQRSNPVCNPVEKADRATSTRDVGARKIESTPDPKGKFREQKSKLKADLNNNANGTDDSDCDNQEKGDHLEDNEPSTRAILLTTGIVPFTPGNSQTADRDGTEYERSGLEPLSTEAVVPMLRARHLSTKQTSRSPQVTDLISNIREEKERPFAFSSGLGKLKSAFLGKKSEPLVDDDCSDITTSSTCCDKYDKNGQAQSKLIKSSYSTESRPIKRVYFRGNTQDCCENKASSQELDPCSELAAPSLSDGLLNLSRNFLLAQLVRFVSRKVSPSYLANLVLGEDNIVLPEGNTVRKRSEWQERDQESSEEHPSIVESPRDAGEESSGDLSEGGTMPSNYSNSLVTNTGQRYNSYSSIDHPGNRRRPNETRRQRTSSGYLKLGQRHYEKQDKESSIFQEYAFVA